MTLDLESAKLSFTVNNQQSIAFENVTKNNQLKYRMAVALHRKDMVTLMQYETGNSYIELLHSKEKEITRLTQEKIQIYCSISKICNRNKHESWDSYDILVWILSLDNNRFLQKYERILKQNLMSQNVRGTHLKEVDKMDILGWGIKDFEDKHFLMKQIQQLVNTEGTV